MGTSLSGLTPATTFDGLLKTSDNDAIGTGLKTIGTGDGTDSVLQLSDSELNVAGQFNVDTGNALNTINLRGDSLVINQIYQANEVTYNSIAMANSAGIQLKNGASVVASIRTQKFGIGELIPTARLQVKGSGATSATTSLLVQNSAGTELLKVQDDGRVDLSSGNLYLNNYTFYNGAASLAIENDMIYRGFGSHRFTTYNGAGSYPEVMRITGNTLEPKVGIGETTPTARLHVKGSGNDITTTSLLVQNSDGADNLIIRDDRSWEINGIGANSSAYIYTASDRIFFRASNKVTYLGQFRTYGFQIGNGAADPIAKLQVKGNGATSATTALLVQNSAGTDYLSVKDNGEFFAGTGYNKISGAGNNLNLDFIALNYRIGASNVVGRMTTDGLSLGNGAANPTARLQVKGSGNDATTTALLVQNSDGDDKFKVNDAGGTEVTTNEIWKLTLQSNDLSQFLKFSYNNIYTTNALYLSGSSTILQGNGAPRVIAAATGTTIKGSGATSATTALLVENSAGTELLRVRDDGNIYLSWNTDKQVLFPKYTMDKFRLYPLSGQNLGGDTNTNFQFGSAFFNDKIHITDNVASNTSADTSAKLQVDSTTQGFLPPRMTTTERDAISTPAAGLMIYNTDTNTAECWNGSTWMPMF